MNGFPVAGCLYKRMLVTYSHVLKSLNHKRYDQRCGAFRGTDPRNLEGREECGRNCPETARRIRPTGSLAGFPPEAIILILPGPSRRRAPESQHLTYQDAAGGNGREQVISAEFRIGLHANHEPVRGRENRIA